MSKEAVVVEYRVGKRDNKERTLNSLTILVEEVQEIIRVRKLQIHNWIKIEPIITENKIIIDYAKKCIKKQKLSRDKFNQINHIYIHKKLILLAELVGLRGTNVTVAFYNINEMSLLKQKLEFLNVKKLLSLVIKV